MSEKKNPEVPSNVVEICSKGKALAAKEDKKEDNVSEANRLRDISEWIDHKFGCAFAVAGFRAFPYKMVVVKDDLCGEPIIIAVSPDKTCARMSLDFMAGVIKREMDELSTEPKFHPYWCNLREATKVAENWLASRKIGEKIPKSVAFADDPEPAFHRIAFKKPGKAPGLNLAPTWASFGARMGENWVPFCAWVWSLFDLDSDRKQSVYIFGNTDCGKSRISEAIARMMGKNSPNKGSFCVLDSEYAESRWGNSGLVGRRVCVIDEARHGFLAGNKFKTLTGSREQIAEEKGKSATNITIDTKFLFTSNESPNIPSRQELKERLIVCKLQTHGLTRDQLIPEKELDALLEKEMPTFLAFCHQCYEPYEGGKRIECGYEELDNAIGENEQFEMNTFEALFNKTNNDEDFIPCEEMKERVFKFCRGKYTFSDKFFVNCLHVWKRLYNIKDARRFHNGKQRRGYTNLEKTDYEVI